MNYGRIITLAKKNIPSILSGTALVGSAVTTYFAYKAGQKHDSEKPLKKQWKNYISTAVSFIGTAACIVGANRLHLGKEAALAAAVAFYKACGEDFEDAVFDKFSDAGLKKNVLNTDKNADPPASMTMKIKIWEPYTKQYFYASQQDILWAELTANKMLQQKGIVTLNDVLRLYNDPNIKLKKKGDTLGWSYDDEMFCESSSYYYAGGWIDMCPQFEDTDGKTRFVMDYGINPIDISDLN